MSREWILRIKPFWISCYVLETKRSNITIIRNFQRPQSCVSVLGCMLFCAINDIDSVECKSTYTLVACAIETSRENVSLSRMSTSKNVANKFINIDPSNLFLFSDNTQDTDTLIDDDSITKVPLNHRSKSTIKEAVWAPYVFIRRNGF